KLARVEAGTQGPHKLQRGYVPVQTRSAHWIPDPAFREAVARFLEQERAEEAREMDYLGDETPYRQDVRDS
ncbi:MAG: peptidogalycan biosysnthesis protein, partial [Rickettsiales bacterium]